MGDGRPDIPVGPPAMMHYFVPILNWTAVGFPFLKPLIIKEYCQLNVLVSIGQLQNQGLMVAIRQEVHGVEIQHRYSVRSINSSCIFLLSFVKYALYPDILTMSQR